MTFDLGNEDGPEHYKAFSDELARLRAHRVMDRACLINLNTASARRVSEALKELLDEKDRIFVMRVDTQTYWYLNAFPETNEWLKANPPEPAPALPEPAAEGADDQG